MSMNIHIAGTGFAKYPSGRELVIWENFNVNQTPTNITNKILESTDYIKEYKDWVISYSKDEQEEIVDWNGWDETTQYYPVIGHKTVNYGKDHCAALDIFLKDIEEKGLKLEVYSS